MVFLSLVCQPSGGSGGRKMASHLLKAIRGESAGDNSDGDHAIDNDSHGNAGGRHAHNTHTQSIQRM